MTVLARHTMLRVMHCLRSAARSARARPLGASHGVGITATNALAFSTRAETTARNAADVRDLLRTRLSLTDAEVDKVERFQPVGARATVEPKLTWLQKRFELDAAQLRQIVVRHPYLLLRKVESMESNCDWLQWRLDLDDVGLRKIVVSRPPLMGYSVEDNMEPTLKWLQTRLDLDEAQLGKVVVRFPPLLGLSVEDNLAPKLGWLQTRLELDEAELRKMVVALPQLLTYSVEDKMAPTLEFLAQDIGLSRAELRDWVVKNPPCLSYSLTNRYRPRLEACRAAGVDAKRVLSYATRADEFFCEITGIAPEALVAARESVLSV